MHLRLRRIYWVRAALLCAISVGGLGLARAQTQGLIGNELLRSLQSGQGLQPQDTIVPQTPPVQIYQPVIPELVPPAPPSRLEALYSQRAGRPLRQFGYDILGVPTPVNAAQVGGVQDDYVLGEGDEIVIDLRGEDNVTYRQRVNRNGQIVLPRLTPIQVSGRSFGQVRADLERQVAQSYISTNVFASVGQIRQISVLITGEVRAPGTRIISGLATPLDALLLSGGIAKTGSLRNVALIRGNRTIPLDLYALLMQGTLPDVGGLRSGDRLYVPPLRSTIAVAGLVRRPGIYELREGQSALDANALIQLAGGPEIDSINRLSKASVEPDGGTRLVSIPQGGAVASGEVLLVDPASEASLERISLTGSARLTGTYPRSVASSVGRLIHSFDELSADAYAFFAVIVRRDPKLNVRTLVPFSLVPIFSGAADVPLQNDDQIYVFTRTEVRILADTATSRVPRTDSPVVAGISVVGRLTAEPTDPIQPIGAPVPGPTTFPYFPRIAPNGYCTTVPTPYEVNAAPLNAAGRPPSALGYPYNGNNPYLNGTLPNGILPNGAIPNGIGPNFPGANRPDALGANNFGAAVPFGTPNGAPNFPGFAPGQGAGAQPTPQYGTLPQYQSSPPPGQDCTPLPVSPESVALKLGVTPETLLRLVADHVIWVEDEVRDPGPYPATDGITLAEMIQLAGGVLRQADLSAVEVSSKDVDSESGVARTSRAAYKGSMQDFQRVSLRASDVVRLRPVFSDRIDGRVTIAGEVRYPGAFDIVRGERLSALLERAGGLTDAAFPIGAIFTRQSAAAAERLGNERESRALSGQIASLASSANPEDRQKVALLNTLSQELRDAPALGRISTTVDPAILRVRPELDILLEPGDRFIIPSRPSTVTVAGDVLSPGSFQYQPGLDIQQYITLAGGVTQDADEDRIFMVLPDGTARPLNESWLSFSKNNVVPLGATIVVPRDLRPFNLTIFLRDASQIMSQLAISAASLAVVGRY
jgi:polysaccharide biosynthesis/export protein